LDQQLTTGIRIRVRPPHDESTLRIVHEIIRGYPGPHQFQLDIDLADGGRVQMESGKKIDLAPELVARLKDALGAANVEYLFVKPDLKPAPPPLGRSRQSAAV
jgi:hypothetical protein